MNNLSIQHETLLAQMESDLNALAMAWRGATTSADEIEIARRYQAILTCMVELGFQQALDADAELPNNLMPSAYLKLFAK